MGLSSLSTTPLEEVVAAGKESGDISHVLQLYLMKNRGTSERLVRRAESMSIYFICILRNWCPIRQDIRGQSAGFVPFLGRNASPSLGDVVLPQEKVHSTPAPLFYHFLAALFVHRGI